MPTALKITREYSEFILVYDEGEKLLHVKVKPDVIFDLDLTKKQMKIVEDFVGERKHKALIEMGEFNSSSDESRKFYAENMFINNYRIADAFIVKSLSVRLIINFFIQFHKPKIPTKAFADIEKAKTWLNSLYFE